MNHLALIVQALKRREDRRAEFETADTELRRLICEGYAEGVPAKQIAEVTQLSLARVYQILDHRR